MQSHFPGYYASGSDIDLHIEKTLVVFDANVLLNLYRYPANAASDLLAVMGAVADRKWLPFQAALEYQRNRLTVIAEQNRRFREAKKVVDNALASLEGELSKLQLQKRHSTIDPEPVLTAMRNARDEFASRLDRLREEHKDVTDDDTILEKLTKLFDSRVGTPPKDQGSLDAIESEGKDRYESKSPPGYQDQSKEGEYFYHAGLRYSQEYGDLVLWKQIIEHCLEQEIEQLIFVTDDDKDDWWLIVDSGGKRKIGPRPELTDEICRLTNVTSFVMLSSDRFAQRFSEMLDVTLKQSTVTQVKDVQSTLTNQVTVTCPECSVLGTQTLGETPGSSAVHYCAGCSARFHVHRRGDSSVFFRKWGASTAEPQRVEATCPQCESRVPASIRADEDTTERYCMQCCTLLTIAGDGAVVDSQPSQAVDAILHADGNFASLECPICPSKPRVRTIWRNAEIVRAVCWTCSRLLQAQNGQSGA